LLKVNIKTGRTHQIRVHLSSIGHAIVGDKMYGNINNISDEGLYLHSYKLVFQHPKTKIIIKIKDTIPKSFNDLLNKNNIKNIKYE
jgi:23S rRNA-/tRNA-specific pseudouridylate synthase